MDFSVYCISAHSLKARQKVNFFKFNKIKYTTVFTINTEHNKAFIAFLK